MKNLNNEKSELSSSKKFIDFLVWLIFFAILSLCFFDLRTTLYPEKINTFFVFRLILWILSIVYVVGVNVKQTDTFFKKITAPIIRHIFPAVVLISSISEYTHNFGILGKNEVLVIFFFIFLGIWYKISLNSSYFKTDPIKRR